MLEDANNKEAQIQRWLKDARAAFDVKQFAEAARFFHLAAEKGSAEAWYLLAGMYEGEFGVKKDMERAAEFYRFIIIAASDGDVIAQFFLGKMYEYGDCVQANMETAIISYRVAAQRGCDLGTQRLKALADEGYSVAQISLGQMYEKGNGVQKNMEEAVSYYVMAVRESPDFVIGKLKVLADQGAPEAQNALGHVCEKGIFLIKNDKKALKLYALAAQQGYPPAQYNLAWMFLGGANRDKNKALHLLFQSAQKGYAPAKNDLWEFIKNTNDPTNCLKELAVKEGVESLRIVGNWYASGELGGQINLSDAVECYHAAAVKGDKKAVNSLIKLAEEVSYPQAQYRLGYMYYYGEGVAKDDKEAVKWSKMAAENADEIARGIVERLAEKTNADAQCAMGDWYASGKVVDAIDVNEAINYYYRAVTQGHSEALNKLIHLAEENNQVKAQYRLARMYYSGQGVQQDDTATVKWSKMAAENGDEIAKGMIERLAEKDNADASCVMGDWHVEGRVVGAITFDEAINYYYKAAIKGHLEALNRLIHLGRERNQIKAQYYLGNIYYYGDGVIKDYVVAVKWLRMAAENKDERARDMVEHLAKKVHPEALCIMGDWYRTGSVFKKNFTQAISQYELAAAKGNATALSILERLASPDNAEIYLMLGKIYMATQVICNFEKASDYLEQALRNNMEVAACYLGLLNEYGVIASVSKIKISGYYYTRAIKAGYPLASILLGIYYQRGAPHVDASVNKKTIEKMYGSAANLQKKHKSYSAQKIKDFFEAMAQSENILIRIHAKLVLTVMYEYGFFHTLRMRQEDSQAKQKALQGEIQKDCLFLFKQPAASSDEALVGYCKMFFMQRDKQFAYILGCLYRDGRGVNKDNKIAFDWFSEGVKLGDAEAQYYMGVIYEKGLLDNPIDLKKAKQHYDLALGQKHLGAQYQLSLLLSQSKDKEENERSIRLLIKLAEEGYVRAQFKLGGYYHCGCIVPQNWQTAHYLYEQAAFNGHVEAQYTLGTWYENGEGVPRDMQKACGWYKQVILNQNHVAEYGSLSAEEVHSVLELKRRAQKDLTRIAEDANVHALLTLSILYMSVPDILDGKKAYEYMGRLMKDDQAKKDTCCYFGLLYEYGIETPTQSTNAALKFYIRAIDTTLVLVNVMLCLHSLKGQAFIKEAQYSCYKRATEFLDRAVLLQENGQDKSDVQILSFFKIQLENVLMRVDLKEDIKKDLFVSTNLFFALIYTMGLLGVSVDLRQAGLFYEQVKKQGDSIILYHLGCLYESGFYNKEPDLKEARDYYQLSARRGLWEACNKMVAIYTQGLLGVEVDLEEAKKWQDLAEKSKIKLATNEERSLGSSVPTSKGKEWEKEEEYNLSDTIKFYLFGHEDRNKVSGQYFKESSGISFKK